MSDIVIYGTGKTGQSLAQLVKRRGDNPIMYDDEHGFVPSGDFCGKTVLLSPGVPPDAKGLAKANRCGAHVVSELNYCMPLCKGQVISVTGTNGKTTVCRMIKHMLDKACYPSRLLGNGGVPFSSEVADVTEDETVVLESSSFQLRNADNFAPQVSVVTNLAPDHITYHGNYAAYVRTKCNNFLHQNPNQFAVFNADDKDLFIFALHAKSRVVFYSLSDKNANCFVDDDGFVVWNYGGKKQRVKPCFPSPYAHNKSNFLAAVCASVLAGVPFADAVEALADFVFSPHRMQFVAESRGVTFVDDSKGTNVAATLAAVRCFTCPVALIVGGYDKGESFLPLFSALPHNVVFVAAIGQTATRMQKQAAACGVSVQVFDHYKTAVVACRSSVSETGGVVLLSNACASFDMFDGYAQRGEYFAVVVKEVIDAEKK